jgi:hypothetical protein
MNIHFQGEWTIHQNLIKDKIKARLSPQQANADYDEANRTFEENQRAIDEPALPKSVHLEYYLPLYRIHQPMVGTIKEYKSDVISVSMTDRLGATHDFIVPRTPAKRIGFIKKKKEPAETVRAFVERAIAFAKQTADAIQAV